MVQIIMSWASERKITEANYTLRKIIIKKLRKIIILGA
jgi:hypothetical protein